MGINAAATSPTPLSVASMLNCDAAFRVSRTSTRMPRLLMYFFVSGLSGRISGPRPRSNRSASKALLDSGITTQKEHARKHLQERKAQEERGRGREREERTRTRPHEAQDPQGRGVHVPLAAGVEEALPGAPGPPRERLAGDEQRAAAVEDLGPAVEREAVPHANVHRGRRHRHRAQDVHAREVRLGRLVRHGLVVMPDAARGGGRSRGVGEERGAGGGGRLGRGSRADGKRGWSRWLASRPREKPSVERSCRPRGGRGCDALGSGAAGTGRIEMPRQGRHWIVKGLDLATVVHVVWKQLVDIEGVRTANEGQEGWQGKKVRIRRHGHS